MIVKMLAAAGMMAMLAGSASAATIANPPSAAQKAEFYKTCMSIAHNETLCTCKANAAMSLIDTKFMAIVISAMEGTQPPVEVTQQYAIYIGKSNAICIPGY